MSRALQITVRFHEGRYHGASEWPPAPARLFQALVAGVGPGRKADEDAALRWLGRLPPPVIAAPVATRGQEVRWFVPNNDLDAVGGDPARLPEIRAPKRVHPRLFDAGLPVVYAFAYDDADEPLAEAACRVVDHLYQLGRGIDPAWAMAERLDLATSETRLDGHAGQVYRPTGGAGTDGVELAACTDQTLDSLDRRYRAALHKLRTGVKGAQVFAQLPKPVSATVVYASPPVRLVLELRSTADPERFASRPLDRVVALVESIRDAAAQRLRLAAPALADDLERTLIGRPVDGVGVAPARRVRIVPLPSIGNEHVDRGVRRLLVEVPADSALDPDDVRWAFSALEVDGAVLVPADDGGMLGAYGVRGRHRRWRTVTPAALPDSAARRRVEPTRRAQEAKGGAERAGEEARARAAVVQALRHGGVRGKPLEIHVQREPFDKKGRRAEAFARGTRFAKERLWHVEVALDAPAAGPLVIGDGRFLGLGLLAPETPGPIAYTVVEGLQAGADPEEVARALRRAVMSRVQRVIGERARLSAFFTGHDEGGRPTERGHLAFTYDPHEQRLLVLPPHARRRREPFRDEERSLEILDAALEGLRELRAGAAGLLRLRRVVVDPTVDPLFAPCVRWESATDYLVDRHAKRVSANEAIASDLAEGCRTARLPSPARIDVHRASGVPGRGLTGRLSIEFEVAVPGPILLGRSRHLGGGLFRGVPR